MNRWLISILIYCMGTACSSIPDNNPAQSTIVLPETGLHPSLSITPLAPITIPLEGVTPDELSVGIDGSLYLCDREQAQVVRIDQKGTVLATFSDIDSRAEGAFDPIDVSVAEGIEVYVLDSARSRVLRLDRNLRSTLPVYTPESRNTTVFGAFRGIAFDQASGDLFITDSNTGTIRRIDMLGGNIHDTGSFGTTRTSLRNPMGIHAQKNGMLAIADRGRNVVALQSQFGAELTMIGREVLNEPEDVVWIDGELVAVACRNGIMILDRAGNLAGSLTNLDSRPCAITHYRDILYTVDGISGSIQRYSLTPVQ